jgi:hypothetical protein
MVARERGRVVSMDCKLLVRIVENLAYRVDEIRTGSTPETFDQLMAGIADLAERTGVPCPSATACAIMAIETGRAISISRSLFMSSSRLRLVQPGRQSRVGTF